METYIAYFDILGFKEFIENNDKEYIIEKFSDIFIDSQLAVSDEKIIEDDLGIAPDLSNAEVNCLHVSDSIIFWTKDGSEESFKQIVDVCHTFYWRCMQRTFPIRGCLVLGSIEYQPFQIPNLNGATFDNSSLYGKGLIDAYIKAERQDWAGCYIDKSAIDSVNVQIIYNLINSNKIVYYAVPHKDGTSSYEHTIRIISSNLTNVAFSNLSKIVERLFTDHMNGKPITDSVKRKMFNTTKFLEFFRTEGDKCKEEASENK